MRYFSKLLAQNITVAWKRRGSAWDALIRLFFVYSNSERVPKLIRKREWTISFKCFGADDLSKLAHRFGFLRPECLRGIWMLRR